MIKVLFCATAMFALYHTITTKQIIYNKKYTKEKSND